MLVQACAWRQCVREAKRHGSSVIMLGDVIADIITLFPGVRLEAMSR